MIINKVKSTIYKENLISKGDHVIVGLSGGPDSLCLFNILISLIEEFEMNLYAVHINHNFRPGEAEKDQAFVEGVCKEANIPCFSYSIDVNGYAKKQGLTSEEAGRAIRYQCFYKVAEKIRASYKNFELPVKIAVAQNLNDQAETVLMRIIRGAGTDGLAGIEYKRDGEKKVEIIRPLLDINRLEIEDYCERENLNPCIDKTNSQPLYTRNKIRLDLLPHIKDNYNENILMSLIRLSKIAKIDKDYIASMVGKNIQAHSKVKDNSKMGLMATIPVKVMQELHPAVRHRVVINLFSRIGLTQDISSTHLKGADYIIEEGRTSSMTDFPNDYRLQISYGVVEMFKKKVKEANAFSYMINVNQGQISLKIGELGSFVNAEILVNNKEKTGLSSIEYAKKHLGNLWKTNYAVALSYDEILKSQYPLILRARMQGDWIVPQGMSGKKKIQNFFVDTKVSKDERDSIPLLCLGSQVIWVIGKRISESFKIKEDTDSILVLEYVNDI